jgi:hypothetical protein
VKVYDNKTTAEIIAKRLTAAKGKKYEVDQHKDGVGWVVFSFDGHSVPGLDDPAENIANASLNEKNAPNNGNYAKFSAVYMKETPQFMVIVAGYNKEKWLPKNKLMLCKVHGALLSGFIHADYAKKAKLQDILVKD